jgi:hypothetical protein
MGIRFQCPNGHKLNVKTALAGKRAICPDCGVKLVVPSATLEESPNASAIAAPGVAAAGAPSGIAVRQPTLPAALPQPMANGSGQPLRLDAVSAGATPPQSGLWYVRPANGGQFGPATEDAFRTWIAEGRVLADAHVWRDGWADWKLVRDVADALPVPLAAMPVVVPPTASAPGTAPPPPQRPDAMAAEPSLSGPIVADGATLAASQYFARRRRANQRQLTWAVLMLLAVIVLTGVLIWVIRRNAGAEAAANSSAETLLAPSAQSSYVASEYVSPSRLTIGKLSG